MSSLCERDSLSTEGFPTGDDYLALLFMLFGLIPPTTLNYVALKSFERTWWRLFQKRLVSTKFEIHVLFEP
jgi:hypothetical protein